MSTDTPPTPKNWKGPKRVISWSAAGRDRLHALIAAITDSGNAIMFSRTIDGSALIVSAYSGNQKSKEYVTEVGDIPLLIDWLLSEYS